MNTNSFLAMTQELKRRIVDSGIQGDVVGVADSLSRLSQNSADPSGNSGLANARQQLQTHVQLVEQSPLPLAWLQQLEELGWADVLPQTLLPTVEAALVGNEMTPALAYGLVDPVRRKLIEFAAAIDATLDGLSKFRVSPKRLEPGETALQMLIPRTIGGGTLKSLETDFADLSRFLSPFLELSTGGSVESPPVVSLESSDFGILILLNQLDVAANVSDLLSKLMSAFDQLKKMRELWKQARELPMGADLADKLEDASSDEMNTAIEEIVSGFIAAHASAFEQLPDNRRAEVKTHIKVSVNYAKRRIAAGCGIDVITEPVGAVPSESVEEDVAMRRRIQHNSRAGGYRLGPGETYPPLAIDRPEDK